jgi:hypothetical protein
MIRIDVNGSEMHGSITLNCNTKHESSDQRIVTRNLEVSLEGMPRQKFEDIARGQMTVDAQNRHIRKLPVNEARSWTNKKISWKDIYTRSTRVVSMTDADVKELAKNDVEYRKRLIAELEAMDADKPETVLRKGGAKNG